MDLKAKKAKWEELFWYKSWKSEPLIKILKKINLEKTLSDIDKYINQKKFPEALILLKELKCNNFFVNILDKASNKSILKKKLNLFSPTFPMKNGIDTL